MRIAEGDAWKSAYRYAHWANGSRGHPAPAEEHKLLLVPQSVGECWQGFCSCDQWVAVASLYDYDNKPIKAPDAIREVHAEHATQMADAHA